MPVTLLICICRCCAPRFLRHAVAADIILPLHTRERGCFQALFRHAATYATLFAAMLLRFAVATFIATALRYYATLTIETGALTLFCYFRRFSC